MIERKDVGVMKVGEKFKTILGTQYEIVEISENKVTCVILSGLYKGGASDFDIEEVKRYLKQ